MNKSLVKHGIRVRLDRKTRNKRNINKNDLTYVESAYLPGTQGTLESLLCYETRSRSNTRTRPRRWLHLCLKTPVHENTWPAPRARVRLYVYKLLHGYACARLCARTCVCRAVVEARTGLQV